MALSGIFLAKERTVIMRLVNIFLLMIAIFLGMMIAVGLKIEFNQESYARTDNTTLISELYRQNERQIELLEDIKARVKNINLRVSMMQMRR